MRWFRLYTDLLDDTKIPFRKDNHETFRGLILLLTYAAEVQNDGKIEKKLQEIAWRMRIKEPILKRIIDRLQELKIIKIEETEKCKSTITFINWAKRQYKSDDVTARVKKHRNVSRNKNETLHETPPEQKQIQNRTETDTETDTEKERSKKPSCPISKSQLDSDLLFYRFWRAYPKRIGKGAAEKVWNKIKPDESLLQVMIGSIANSEESEQWQKDGGQYIPNPATWLNQKRWEDELTMISKHSGIDAAVESVENPVVDLTVPKQSKALAIPKSEACQVYREIFKLWPNAIQEKEINEKIISEHDLHKWRECCKAWALAGNRPTSIGGILDWFKNGIKSAFVNQPRKQTHEEKIAIINSASEKIKMRHEINITPERGIING